MPPTTARSASGISPAAAADPRARPIQTLGKPHKAPRDASKDSKSVSPAAAECKECHELRADGPRESDVIDLVDSPVTEVIDLVDSPQPQTCIDVKPSQRPPLQSSPTSPSHGRSLTHRIPPHLQAWPPAASVSHVLHLQQLLHYSRTESNDRLGPCMFIYVPFSSSK